MGERIILKATLADLPKIRERYPFIYLERGRIEVDDSSIKWISADREVIRLPAAVMMTILLGPGTSITHEAVKVLATLNTTVCWVGEDSLMFYAVGQTPTNDTRNLKQQIALATDPDSSLAVAKKMYLRRFPEAKIKSKKLPELMVMEGGRVRDLYAQLAQKYLVLWQGRAYQPGKFELSDLTNKLITSCNSALYALISSIINALGLSPKIGFIHSGSPLPFVYDVADLYKADLVFDLAFALTAKMAGVYDRKFVLEEFRNRVIEYDFMTKCPADILDILEIKASRSAKKKGTDAGQERKNNPGRDAGQGEKAAFAAEVGSGDIGAGDGKTEADVAESVAAAETIEMEKLASEASHGDAAQGGVEDAPESPRRDAAQGGVEHVQDPPFREAAQDNSLMSDLPQDPLRSVLPPPVQVWPGATGAVGLENRMDDVRDGAMDGKQDPSFLRPD